MYAVGIDPGKTTGVVVARLHDNGGLDVLEHRFVMWEDRFDLSPLFERMSVEYGPPAQIAVVVESFRLYPHRSQQQIGSDFPSVHIIGMVDLLVYLWSFPEIVYQPASAIAKVRVLSAHQHLIPPAPPHISDAYKHVRLYGLKRWTSLENNPDHTKQQQSNEDYNAIY